MSRIQTDVRRGQALTIVVDGRPVEAFAGETVATALLAAGNIALRRDGNGNARGLFCNMGTCSECYVGVIRGNVSRRLRACLLPVEAGMAIVTGLDDRG